jgi:glucose-1-phosphate cytidylyltransferase
MRDVMKVVILAGGLGTRLAEETEFKPKPMVEIGGKPILWHIMKIYSHYGFNEFVICLGYKGYLIKEYFLNYNVHMSSVTIDVGTGTVTTHESTAEPWKVTLVDTGDVTMTGGRIKRVREFIGNEDFCLTYGDGVATVDINGLVALHKASGKKATVTSVQPPGRFGSLNIDDGNVVRSFLEKPVGEGGWINGGFFVLKPDVLDYIEGDATIFEQQPLRKLATDGELVAHKHTGFWHSMDTLRDRQVLESMWATGKAPWRVWP